MIPEISTLVKLQGIDLEIIKLNQKKEVLPTRLLELEKNLEEHEVQIQELNERLLDLRTRKTEIEDELELESERLKKSQQKMSAVTNTREYSALQKEIEDIKSANKRREDELLGIDEEHILLNEKIESLNAAKKVIGSEVAAEQKKLDAGLSELDEKIEELKKEKETVYGNVPPDMLAKYNFLSSRRKGVVVAAVTDGVCSACNMNIPPQIYNELLRDEKVMSCPSCQRLVYALKVE